MFGLSHDAADAYPNILSLMYGHWQSEAKLAIFPATAFFV